jgi:hypothetical protein
MLESNGAKLFVAHSKLGRKTASALADVICWTKNLVNWLLYVQEV